MKEPLFSNEVILSWLQYYAQNTAIDLEHVKMIDDFGVYQCGRR